MQLLIMDRLALEREGLENLCEVQRRLPEIRILVWDGCGEGEYSLKELWKGKDGCQLKNVPISELVTALRPILHGGASRPEGRDEVKLQRLTKREREVLVQTAQGKLNKEIADTLGISERTVKNHLSGIFRKLEVSDRTQAALFAVRNCAAEV